MPNYIPKRSTFTRQLWCRCYCAHKLPQKLKKNTTTRVLVATSAVYRHPLQKFHRINETCDKRGNFKTKVEIPEKKKKKACRSYYGEVYILLKVDPPNSRVTSAAVTTLHAIFGSYTCIMFGNWLKTTFNT